MRCTGAAAMVVCGVVSLLLAGTASPAEESDATAVPFDSEHWQLAGEVVQHLGREALRGGATLKDVQLGDGVIDVMVAMDGRRGFPGIRFRMQDPQNTELFYLRPHRNKGYGHALQYTPVFNGMSGWQLYSGAGFTAAAEIPVDEWVPLRIELAGSQARISFADLDGPALLVDRLVRGDSAGGIALTGGPGGEVHWADFSYREDAELDLGPRPVRAPAQGMLRQWQISQVVPLADLDRLRAPALQDLGELKWQGVEVEPSGLVNVSRVVALPRGSAGCVIARTAIQASEAGVRRLDFGYSDEVTVFLNGKALFSGASAFRQRDVEFMGVVGPHDSLVLDLVEGENELVFVLAEGFGGWGFMARLSEIPEGPVVLGHGVQQAWHSNDGWQMPESVVVDARHGAVYVSNMARMNPDVSGFISKLGLDGQVEAMQWATGLDAPTGLAVDEKRLYAVERGGVAVIDLESGEVAQRWSMEAEGFFNDVAVADDGTVYLTDSRAGLVYRIVDGEWSRWLEGARLRGVNGIAVHGDTVVVTVSDSGMVLEIGRANAELRRIVDLSPCLHDGVVPLGQGHYLVSDYSGRVLVAAPDGETEVMVDRTATAVGVADLGADPQRGLVVVPSLYGNSVTAYSVGQQLQPSAE